MSIGELQYLILTLIGVDLVLIITCAYLIRKIRSMPKTDLFDRGIKIFESLLGDADKTSRQFQLQVRRKQSLIDDLARQLDQRIESLTVQLNRADFLLSRAGEGVAESRPSKELLQRRRMKIMTLAGKGCSAEDIADKLSIPQGEVKLVIDLSNTSRQT